MSVGARGGQKSELDPLELELQLVVHYQYGNQKANLSSIQEQQVLLVTEPSVQPLRYIFEE